MGNLRRVCKLAFAGLLLVVLVCLAFISLALHTLEARYSSLSSGLTVEKADQAVGALFRARVLQWDDIPEIYTEHHVPRLGSVVREYEFLGISGLSVIVIFDKEGFLYLKIPVYE